MRLRFALMLLPFALFTSRNSAAQDSPAATEAHESVDIFERVVANQKKNDQALDAYERLERVEIRGTGSDGKPGEVKIFRVIPAGTGVDHIPVDALGKPLDAAAYRAELQKLAKNLAWAAEPGRAQQEAYEKVAKKRKERDDLIDATRSAFLFTFLSKEERDGRVLSKYRMDPNPAFKPTSRLTTFFTKVSGTVWIDDASGQLARIDGQVTDDITVGLFLAKVYRGSHFMQERYELVPGIWVPTFSQYDFDGRKFLMSINIHERTFYTDYRLIGPPKEALKAIRAELDNSSTSASGH